MFFVEVLVTYESVAPLSFRCNYSEKKNKFAFVEIPRQNKRIVDFVAESSTAILTQFQHWIYFDGDLRRMWVMLRTHHAIH